MTESVLALKTWVSQESFFHTIASETVHGLTGQTANTKLTQSKPNRIGHRTLFIRTEACQPQPIQPCQTCKKQHRVGECHEIIQKDLSERWDIAKRLQLCFDDWKHCMFERSPVAEHFRSTEHDFLKHASVCCIDHSPEGTDSTRKSSESYWIRRLNTLRPHGINKNDLKSQTDIVAVYLSS